MKGERIINKIERKKISIQIVEHLKEMIKQGNISPNSKLPSENELASMFGVSRSPVREALSILEASGIIESKQGGGSYVKEVRLVDRLDSYAFEMINIEQVYDLLEMRTIIESEAAALAASRATNEDIDNIKLALDDFTRKMKDEHEIGSDADFNFHKEIVKAAYNPFLLQTVENLRELYKSSLTFTLKQNLGLKRKREQIYEEHLEIYKAIVERNSDLAAYHMKRHLFNVRIKLGDSSIQPLPKEMN